MNPCASLVEAMRINVSFYGILSREFAIFMALFLKSCALGITGKIISFLFGAQALTRVRLFYTKKMFVK